MQFTEDWFAYDDAIAMRTWLEEAIRTELFGPTFENSGPWQLMKPSRRDWIAPQASRCVSEESEQSSGLMYDNLPRIRGSPHSRQSNSATEHMDTHKGVQEGTITPIIDGSPARSKNEKQLEIRLHTDFLRLSASNSATEHMDTHKGVQEGTITPIIDGSPARSKNEKQLEIRLHTDFLRLSASNSATEHMDTHKGVQEGTITPIIDDSPARSKNEKQLEIRLHTDFLRLSASNSATEHMDTHKGVQEGTITPNTDGSPARSKNEKQLEMEGHRDFIQECAIEDEEWKWSPVYLLLRDFYGLSAYLPRPWKHTAEEWDLIEKFIKTKYRWLERTYFCSSIVVALQCTWRLHFSENITDVDLNTLSQRLEHVSQEKEFVSHLSLVQDLMRDAWDKVWIVSLKEKSEPSIRNSPQQQILANDIASFKAPSETPGHQHVMKRVCNHLSAIAGKAMTMCLYDPGPENLKDMWIRDCPKNEQEMIKKWKSRLYHTYVQFY